MVFSHEELEQVLNSIPGYRKVFYEVYKMETITIDHVTEAIAAFEETLVTPNAPFDRYLKGNTNAISESAKRGYQVFKDNGCISCHNGEAVGGNSFQKLGIVKPYPTENLGRYDVTKNKQDMYVFKVPTLRNIELTYPYFHDGHIDSLEEAVRLMGEYQLGISLKEHEVKDIVTPRTLTGRFQD